MISSARANTSMLFRNNTSTVSANNHNDTESNFNFKARTNLKENHHKEMFEKTQRLFQTCSYNDLQKRNVDQDKEEGTH